MKVVLVITLCPHSYSFRCLLAKRYNAAMEVLNDDIFDVNPHRTGTTPTDFFLYCYYGGLIAAGESNFGMELTPCNR